MMKRISLVIMIIVSVLGIYSFRHITNNSKTSYASYYHDKFNGKKTASGEVFDNSKFTAANLTLPFGTVVKITNLQTSKSILVRINDRGPFTKGRAFDLSKAAFNAIGHHSTGTIPIGYEILD